MKGIKGLPDCYRKDVDSNNYKLLELNQLATSELRMDIQMVFDCLDLNQASGKILELYGDTMGQRRGLLNDEQYRYMILSQIGRNVLVLMFGSKMGDITMDDLEIVEDDRPCVVKLTKFPVFVLVNAGFSSRQAVAMIETLLPICVTLSADNFEGTFEFSDSVNEYDESAGFGDIEQTVGGYLGLYLGDDDKIPVLPI